MDRWRGRGQGKSRSCDRSRFLLARDSMAARKSELDGARDLKYRFSCRDVEESSVKSF